MRVRVRVRFRVRVRVRAGNFDHFDHFDQINDHFDHCDQCCLGNNFFRFTLCKLTFYDMLSIILAT